MSFEDADLLREFVVESQEHLSDVENQLLTLESQGDAMDVALVNTVFRAVHSIKGAAGFMGLQTLETLAHREEEVLNMLRNKELRPTSVVINTLLRASDRLKTLLDNIENSNAENVEEHITALERILAGHDDLEADTPSSASANTPLTNELSNEALREFLVESYDNLGQLEGDLMKLEKLSDSTELLNSVFRNIHTIKGSSGFLGLTRIEQITHAAENILGAIRDGQFPLDDELAGAQFEMIDAVRAMLAAVETTGSEGDLDPTQLTGRLTDLLESRLSNKPAKTRKAKGTAAKAAAPKTAKPKATKPAASEEKVAQAITPAVTTPAPTVSAQVQPLAINPPASVASPVESVVAAKPAAQVAATSAAVGEASANKSTANEQSAADSTIRVDVSLLDKLMTCVGELVLARNQILQYSNAQSDNELHATTQRLNLITTELQEGVMKTRMQPIGNVWAKFPRLVRDLAAICEKQVRIEMEGKETELDKTIIEAIKDPLTHLVRNTVDHGIERADVRVANGKPAEGCLTLKAYHEGGQVNIEIVDDGAGLNLDRIRTKAVERGLMPADQVAKLADRDVANLIFLPGFSTAEKVSNVSGRGVGMDVVKTNIEKIGGTVDLQSHPGLGTTIKIRIPLTLAIIPALIVTNDHNRYAIPQVNLLELVRLDGNEVRQQVEWIQGAPVYRLRGRLLPLVYLRNELKTKSLESGQSQSLNIVVLRAEDRCFGLVVDRISDTEEIVVKPLSKQLKGIPVYSGTTIMGDGKVALILDIPGLAQQAHVITQAGERSAAELHEHSANRSADTETLLVLGVGESHRYAVPLSLVTRLEKLERSTIEIADHQEVVQYRGEILPLIRLASVMGVAGQYDQCDELLEVVVYTENGCSVGIVVDRIIDIVDASLAVKRTTVGSCLLGSAVIQDHVTDLLDLSALVRQFIPQSESQECYA